MIILCYGTLVSSVDPSPFAPKSFTLNIASALPTIHNPVSSGMQGNRSVEIVPSPEESPRTTPSRKTRVRRNLSLLILRLCAREREREFCDGFIVRKKRAPTSIPDFQVATMACTLTQRNDPPLFGQTQAMRSASSFFRVIRLRIIIRASSTPGKRHQIIVF